MGRQQQVDAIASQALEALPGQQGTVRCPVIPLDMVGLVKGSPRMGGIAAEDDLAIAASYDIAQGTTTVAGGCDGAQSYVADYLFGHVERDRSPDDEVQGHSCLTM